MIKRVIKRSFPQP